ncbi:MAG: response regulator [Gammaproteobacteria bacterium]|jgi:two-component system OmpR family response regulator|nr:response regulator [Gammaproteobacteria bacterium]
MAIASPGEWGAIPGAGLGPRLHAPLLLVEDNAALRQMLNWELSELGYQVCAASGCGQARALIDRQPLLRFALIDIRLPDGDGRALGTELAARAPGLAIVLMSGAHDLEPDPGLAPHVRAFLRKPVNLSSIHQLFAATDEYPRQCASSR